MIALTEKWSDHKETFDLAKKMVAEGRNKELMPKMLDNWYYLTAETYLDFGERGNPIDVFNFYDKHKISLLSEITIPILVIYGKNDTASCVPITEAIEQLKDKAKKSPYIDSIVIDNTGHSYEGKEIEMAEGVTNWLINSKESL